MKKLTEKEMAWIDEIVRKALDKDRPSLTEKEVSELQGLLKRLYEWEETQKKKASKTSLSEVIEVSLTRALAEKALKESEHKAFEQLPVSEKMKKLSERVDRLVSSPTMKALQIDNAKKAENEAFEAYYEQHAKQFGKSL